MKTLLAITILFLAGCGSKPPIDPDLPPPPPSSAPAFPGAEGGGKFVTGGRGGKVLYVTTLEDNAASESTPGTLRYAVTRDYARTVLFQVAGIIHLHKALDINQPDITIAGQSAPGDGICIADHQVTISADHVIIRYIRVRPGDLLAKTFPAGSSKRDIDGISGRYYANIMIDHCSFSWSTDETCSLYGCRNLTVQWCIISESLNYSEHSGGNNHGMGGIWGGNNATYHHNLLAFNNNRNPRFDHPDVYVAGYSVSLWRGNNDFVNNVIAYWGDNSGYGGQEGRYNIVNNCYIQRSAGKYPNRIVQIFKNNENISKHYPWGKWYISGNYLSNHASLTTENWLNAGTQITPTAIDFSSPPVPLTMQDMLELKSPFPLPMENYAITPESALNAYNSVIAKAGANKIRDSHDLRVIGYIQNPASIPENSGSKGSRYGIIDSQSDVGGWGTYNFHESDLPVDTDGDGIPDTWEDFYLLNKNDSTDGAKKAIESTYTNLEIYLNSLIP